MEPLEISDPRWADLVQACPEAFPFHQAAWGKLLAECYGYRAFLLGRNGAAGQLTAGIPVLEVRHPLGGRRWISLPFTDYCPPLATSDQERNAFVADLDAARSRAGIAQLEVRAPIEGPGAYTQPSAVMHTLGLSPDPESVFRAFHRSQVQRNIQRAEREGVTVRRAESRSDLIETFYALHLQTRHRQGVPIQPRRYFDLLWRKILEPGLGFLLLAYADQAPAAGAVFLTGNQIVSYKYGASDPSFWGPRPNHAIFWSGIRWACEQGYRIFDFGRTDFENEGLREFKSGWGAVEEPLVYSYLGQPPGDLSPARLAHALGEVIRRSPPWVCRTLGELLYQYAA